MVNGLHERDEVENPSNGRTESCYELVQLNYFTLDGTTYYTLFFAECGRSSSGGSDSSSSGSSFFSGGQPAGTGGDPTSSGGSGSTAGTVGMDDPATLNALLPDEDFCFYGTDDNGECMSEEEYEDYLADLWEQSNITTTNAFDQNPCTKGVLDALDENNIGYDLLTSFLGDNPTAEVIIDITPEIPNSSGDGTISAHTLPPANGTIKIEVSQEYLNQGRSNLEVARTLLHELIHAELFAQTSLNGNSFSSLFENFVRPRVGSEQHNVMSQYYVDRLASMMQQFDQNVNGQDYGLDMYRAGAWVGLENTDLWISGLNQDEKDAIKGDQQILYNYREQCK